MFNVHLLQLELSPGEFERISPQLYTLHPESYLNRLPAYLIARCPFCGTENIERLNTYSVKGWIVGYGADVFDHRAVVHHCEHFTLVQSFFNFHGIWPAEAKGRLGPEVPHVIGHLLQSGNSLAVIHALPICRIEGNHFSPRYTLFMVSYFSQEPKKAYDAVIAYNVKFVEPGVAWPFIPPPDGCEQWWDLATWVATGQLFWVDTSNSLLRIRTDDVNAFPYGHITGRIWPYFHSFPLPLPENAQYKT